MIPCYIFLTPRPLLFTSSYRSGTSTHYASLYAPKNMNDFTKTRQYFEDEYEKAFNDQCMQVASRLGQPILIKTCLRVCVYRNFHFHIYWKVVQSRVRAMILDISMLQSITLLREPGPSACRLRWKMTLTRFCYTYELNIKMKRKQKIKRERKLNVHDR